MTKWRKRALLIFILLLLLAGAAGWATAWMRTQRAIDAEAARQLAVAAELGMRKAVVRKEKRMGEEMTELREELVAMREAGVPPVVTTRVVTREVPVEVPVEVLREVVVPVDCPTPASVDEPGETPSFQPSRLHVGGTMEGLFGATRRGDVVFKGKFFVNLRWQEWRETVDLPIDEENSAIEVSDDLKRALERYYNRPTRIGFGFRRPKHWRVGWSLGVGGCLVRTDEFRASAESIATSTNFEPCAGALWGVQF